MIHVLMNFINSIDSMNFITQQMQLNLNVVCGEYFFSGKIFTIR